MLLQYNTHVRLPLKGRCGWQVRRTQALTVLLALVRADLGTSTLDTLQTSGLLGSLLQDLTNNARADLLQACLNPESSTPAFVLHEDSPIQAMHTGGNLAWSARIRHCTCKSNLDFSAEAHPKCTAWTKGVLQ